MKETILLDTGWAIAQIDPADRIDPAKLATVKGGGFEARLSVPIDHPLLWWPRGMGRQSLYQVKAELYRKGTPCELYDEIKKRVGFRTVENPSSMEFIVNGKRVRLFGGCLDPLQGYTHCYKPDRVRRMFTMVENANMNTLRIWAEGHPLPDSFYE
jgi:beta-galactosidase/beta-glucuronidase